RSPQRSAWWGSTHEPSRIPSQAVRSLPATLVPADMSTVARCGVQEEVSSVTSGELEHSTDGETRRLERAVVIQLLRDDCAARGLVAALEREVSDFTPALLEGALARLEHAGVVCRAGESVWASRAARRLDELDLIGI